MRYAAAYALAILGGNANPDVAAISRILGSVGIECDNAKAQKVVDACKGKDFNQIIEEGTKKLSNVQTAVAVAPAASGAAPVVEKAAAKEEPKKEEKKKEESDDDDDIGLGLFD